jgi:hypothetical protein
MGIDIIHFIARRYEKIPDSPGLSGKILDR